MRPLPRSEHSDKSAVSSERPSAPRTGPASGPPVDAAAVDVVIVTYQSEAWIGRCLDSLEDGAVHGLGTPAMSAMIGTVIVVDNASTDGTENIVRARQARGVRWVPLGKNHGFGAAANRGIAASMSEFVTLLNPDLIVESGAIATLATALTADSGLALVGPRVCDLDGTPYPSARCFPDLLDAAGHGFVGLVWKDNPWSRRYLAPDRVDWISGTAMMLRRDAFEAVGGFDEAYFMYVEDVDLCFRLAKAGWRVGLVADATVRHAIGGSSQATPYRMIVAHHRSLWLFATRSTRGPERLLLPVVGLALMTRAAAVSVRRLVNKRPPASRRSG